MADYQPPFTLTREIVLLATEIGERVGRLAVQFEQESTLRLRRINRIRTVTGSLAIEGNTLSLVGYALRTFRGWVLIEARRYAVRTLPVLNADG